MSKNENCDLPKKDLKGHGTYENSVFSPTVARTVNRLISFLDEWL